MSRPKVCVSRIYITCSDQHTSIYAGELLSRFEGGCQSFGCLFKFAVTNHCSLGQPGVKIYKIEKKSTNKQLIKLWQPSLTGQGNVPEHGKYMYILSEWNSLTS